MCSPIAVFSNQLHRRVLFPSPGNICMHCYPKILFHDSLSSDWSHSPYLQIGSHQLTTMLSHPHLEIKPSKLPFIPTLKTKHLRVLQVMKTLIVFSVFFFISFSVPYLLCWHCTLLNQEGYCFKIINALHIVRSNSSCIVFFFLLDFRSIQNKGSVCFVFCFDFEILTFPLVNDNLPVFSPNLFLSSYSKQMLAQSSPPKF